MTLSAGVFLTGCGSAGSHNVSVGGTTYSHPSALALDGFGRLYIADSGNSRIVVLSRAGKTLNAWTTNPSHYGCNDEPSDVRVDGHTNVYVWVSGFCSSFSSSSYPHRRIMEFSGGGTLLHTWSQDSVEIALANAGGVYVCKGRVNVPHVRRLPTSYCEGGGRRTVDTAGNIYSTYSTELTRPSGFYCPAQTSRCWKSCKPPDCTRGSIPPDAPIAKFSPTGIVLGRFGDWPVGDPNHGPGVRGEYRFTNPGDIAVDRAENMYVTDDNRQDTASGVHEATRGAVVKLSPRGATMAVWSGFQSPVAVGLDGNNAVYVLDAGAGSLSKLSPRGKVLRVWRRS